MKRQLQIKNSLVQSEWHGSGEMPLLPVPHDVDLFNEDVRAGRGLRLVSPDRTLAFVDVTNRPDAQGGMTYDAATDTFTPPPAPPDYGKSVSPRDFLRLFTNAERKAARNMADRRHASYDADVEDFMAMASVPEPIRLKHPDTILGLGLLVAKGVITAARRDAILNS